MNSGYVRDIDNRGEIYFIGIDFLYDLPTQCSRSDIVKRGWRRRFAADQYGCEDVEQLTHGVSGRSF